MSISPCLYVIISNETDIEMFASFAPNGKYVVYESETVEGKSGIYVQPIPRTGEKIKIATDAAEPYWIEDGKQIVFRSKNYDRMYSVEVDFTDGFSAGTPELLWQGYYLNVPGRSYCVTSNGNLFLMKKSIETNHQRQSLNVIENWQLEVREALQD